MRLGSERRVRRGERPRVRQHAEQRRDARLFGQRGVVLAPPERAAAGRRRRPRAPGNARARRAARGGTPSPARGTGRGERTLAPTRRRGPLPAPLPAPRGRSGTRTLRRAPRPSRPRRSRSPVRTRSRSRPTWASQRRKGSSLVASIGSAASRAASARRKAPVSVTRGPQCDNRAVRSTTSSAWAASAISACRAKVASVTSAVTLGLPSRSPPIQLRKRNTGGNGAVARQAASAAASASSPKYVSSACSRSPITRGRGREQRAAHVVQRPLDLVAHRRSLVRELARLPERRHLRLELRAPRRLVHRRQVGLAERPHDGAHALEGGACGGALDLRRVGRQRELHVQPGHEATRFGLRPAVVVQALDRRRHRLAARRLVRGGPSAEPHDAHPMQLLGQVHQLEVEREGAQDLLGVAMVEAAEERLQLRLDRCAVPAALGQGPHALDELEHAVALELAHHVAEGGREQVDLPAQALERLRLAGGEHGALRHRRPRHRRATAVAAPRGRGVRPGPRRRRSASPARSRDGSGGAAW